MADSKVFDLLVEVAPSLAKLVLPVVKREKELTGEQIQILLLAATYEELQKSNKLLEKHCEDVSVAINGFKEDVLVLKQRTSRLRPGPAENPH